MKRTENRAYLIVLLAILSSVAPIGTDTYIPSIPNIAKVFHVSIQEIELTLSIFLIGFSIGQIFGGPLSDRYGRRKSSIVGLLGFSVVSLLIVFSTSIYELWIYRFIEAFFGGIVVVNGSAAVRDRFHGEEAAEVFSLIGTVRSLAPLIAPAIGSFIIHFFSWKAVFIFLSAYSAIVAFMVWRSLHESFTYQKQEILKSYLGVLTHKTAMKAMLVLSFSFSGMFILISKSPFIYIEYFHISTDEFPLFFGFNFVVLIGMIKVNLMLLKHYKAVQLIIFAILIQILAAGLLMLSYKGINLMTAMMLIATYMSMMAFIFGNCMALALEHFSKNAGVASSVVGVLQFGVGALISSLALMYHNDDLLPIGVSIGIVSCVSLLLILSYPRGKETQLA
ncbi:multidrug effflux MFS transporter [Sulfurospirillum sp. 1612]|uniref:multidrug effflux MFS transporter n=1 Tax=Sulfurospirillum sp. 1612 TaxID=3094835 RepID=UPI002F953CFA